jgi:hypothetical protein
MENQNKLNEKIQCLKNIINATDDTILKQAIQDIEERIPFYIMATSKKTTVVHNPFLKALGNKNEYENSITEIVTL